MLDPRLASAIADVFGVDSQAITPESGPGSLPDWDSVGHLRLVLYLEEEFRVRFPARAISGLTSAGSLQEALEKLKAL